MDLKSFLLNAKAFEGSIESYSDKIPLLFLARGGAVEFKIENGNRKILRFFDENQFIFRLSADHAIEMLEESEIVTLAYENIIRLLKKFPEVPELHKALKTDYWMKRQQFEKELRTKTVVERYFDLFKRQPWVLETVEPADIASYLNISLVDYERMRKVD